MQVAALQQFLRSLVPALEAAGEARTAARWLDEAARALEPFRALALPEFAAFLRKADEYHRAGAVRVPTPADEDISALGPELARLTASPAAAETRQAQTRVQELIERMAQRAGLKGSLKPDPKWAESRATQARVGPVAESLRRLGGRINSPEDYAADEIAGELARIQQALGPGDLPVLADSFGVGATAKSKADKVLRDILAQLTGHRPGKPKAGNRQAVAADPAVVERHATRLKELANRATDPALASEADVEALLTDLKGLKKPTLFEVIQRAGIEGVRPGDSAGRMLDRVRERLTVARRFFERTQA